MRYQEILYITYRFKDLYYVDLDDPHATFRDESESRQAHVSFLFFSFFLFWLNLIFDQCTNVQSQLSTNCICREKLGDPVVGVLAGVKRVTA